MATGLILRQLWRVNAEDARQCGCNITGAPLVVNDIVNAGATSDAREQPPPRLQ